jgi:hypothetical protein
MLKIPAEYDRNTSSAKLTDISLEFLPAPLLHIFAGISQRALVAELEMIRSQMGTHNRSENERGVWDALYDTTP